jgi:demethylmenaquinone methyltransferase/2-methoxy-6-polyprenyl-1,4-benzoquinol methylase
VTETFPVSAQPSPHEPNRAFYDRISAAYDLLSDTNERAARQAGVQALAMKPGERVLEIGCGTGNELLDLASLVGPTGQVCGIDVSSGMLEVSRRKLEKHPPTGPVELREGDARKLPFPDASFDAVYCSFTLELFSDDDIPRVLAEVRRVLRAGGRVGVVSMAKVKPGEKPSLLERSYVWMHRHFPHIVDCRPIDPTALLTAAGFRVTKQAGLEIWTMPVAVIAAEKPLAGTT